MLSIEDDQYCLGETEEIENIKQIIEGMENQKEGWKQSGFKNGVKIYQSDSQYDEKINAKIITNQKIMEIGVMVIQILLLMILEKYNVRIAVGLTFIYTVFRFSRRKNPVNLQLNG